MYPFVRMFWENRRAKRLPRLGILDTHVSHHTCLPWDLDPWKELNNGRTLTLYDLGRIPMVVRMDMVAALAANRWGITVAGNSTRYRRRIRVFERFEMRSRCVGWDAKFIYMDQSMWRGDACCSQLLVRSAITSAKGIVPPAELLRAMGQTIDSPPLPGWVAAWVAADAERPWPPET